MDLDDVVESSMLWRGDRSKSPSADEEVIDATEEEDSDLGSMIQLGSPALRATKAASEARRLAKGKGKESDLNGKGKSKSSSMSGFARWDKIPLGAFRDTQSSRGGSSSRNKESQVSSSRIPVQSSSHRLGNFLLTATGPRSGAESSFSVARRNSRHSQESSPFRGRRAARSAEQALSFAMGGNTLLDLEKARAAAGSGRDATFIVSPILWPVRNRRMSGASQGAQIPEDDITSVQLPEALSPSGQSSAYGASDVDMAFGLGGSSRRDLPPGRITKREKREKRARRAAAQLQMQIALAAQAELAQQHLQHRSLENGIDTADTTPPLNEGSERDMLKSAGSSSLAPHGKEANDDSSAASLAMPRLSITDASPRTSPGAQVPVAPLPKRFQREGSASLKGSTEPSGQLMSGPSHASSSMPPPSSTLMSSSSNQAQDSNSLHSASLAQAQTSPVLRPPSSSFGGPLHSPLFGGIGMYGSGQGGEDGDGEGDQVAALSI